MSKEASDKGEDKRGGLIATAKATAEEDEGGHEEAPTAEYFKCPAETAQVINQWWDEEVIEEVEAMMIYHALHKRGRISITIWLKFC